MLAIDKSFAALKKIVMEARTQMVMKSFGLSLVLGLVFLLTSLSLIPPASAQDSDLQQRVNAIESVEQVKQQIREAFQELDQCGVGSCVNATTTAICENVGALDVRVNGQIINQMSGAAGTALEISEADLKLMQLILSQCKPSNYQYWNWDTILHVTYQPTPKGDAEVRSQLGVAPRRQR
jgi:hypothetical protein